MAEYAMFPEQEPSDDHLEFPTVVKVGWRDFRIVQWEHRAATAAERFGEMSAMEGVIRIDRSYGDRRAARTLLHEIMHAVFVNWTLGKEDDEERIVTVGSDGLATVWRDNPEVLRWIGHNLVYGS